MATLPPIDVPTEIRLAADRSSIAMLAGSRITTLSAETLRAACRCAACRRAALDGSRPPGAGITLTRIEPLGGQALNIAFSDGHDRGVFPFDYLAALACAPAGTAA